MGDEQGTVKKVVKEMKKAEKESSPLIEAELDHEHDSGMITMEQPVEENIVEACTSNQTGLAHDFIQPELIDTEKNDSHDINEVIENEIIPVVLKEKEIEIVEQKVELSEKEEEIVEENFPVEKEEEIEIEDEIVEELKENEKIVETEAEKEIIENG